MEDERYSAPRYVHRAVGNVGGAYDDWCIAEIFSAREENSLHETEHPYCTNSNIFFHPLLTNVLIVSRFG